MADDDVEIEKEVQDFNFRHLCKLRIGSPVSDINKSYRHLAISNKHGLIFAVTSSAIKVVSLGTLEAISTTNVNVNDAVLEFDHETIDVGVDIQMICLNSDETTLIVVYVDGNGVQIAAIDVCIVNSPNKSNAIYASKVLDYSAGVYVKDICRHPESPGIFAVCLSTGHVHTIELIDGSFNIMGSITEIPVCSICWSPKGKQIVLGFSDGRLIQYDKTLKSQKKITCAPDIFNDEPKEAGGLFWISSYVFMVVYNTSSDLSESPIFVIVTAQKEGPPSYLIMDDIYFGFNEERLLCYYFNYIPEWQLMITMASNAMEAVPVGTIQGRWHRWGLPETGRAEVPLNADDNNDAFSVGTGICLNSTLGIKQDDKDLPPAPIFAMLSTDGVLCTYQMVNQSPNINHGILTGANPVPNTSPKTGPKATPPAPAVTTPAPPPNVYIQSNTDSAVSIANIAPSFFPTNKTDTSENSGSAFKFNFAGAEVPQAGPPALTGGIKFAPSAPCPSMFSKPNPQVSTPNFSFNFPGNLGGSGRASPATNPVTLQGSTSVSKPLFNLTNTVPTFKCTGFNFTTPQVDPSPSPKLVLKPPVSVVDTLTPSKPPETSFKPPEPNKFSFTPVVRPFETAADPTKTVFQPIAQQQAIPVKPLVVSLASDNVPNFSQLVSTPNVHPLQRNLNSPALATPNRPIQNATISTPQQTPEMSKRDQSPTVNSEIEQHAAKWNTTLQKNICEEINNFNAELEAFKKSCGEINCVDLIGSRDELVETKHEIALLVNHMDEYKGVMKENKSECAMLRGNVLKNLKMVDEATLLKQKMEDKRYSNAMKSRPLDPISARQRKTLRSHVNQVEQLLNDINVALDTKWEERMAQRRNTRNKTSSIVKKQQVYQTIDAIDQITNNLANRLQKLNLQSRENNIVMMNLSRRHVADKSTSQMSPNNSINRPSNHNSPMKLKQLKSFLNSRGQTPVRRSKPYTSLVLPRDGESNLNPSFSSFPKAASTPFPAQGINTPRVSAGEKHPLSSTLSTIGNKSMTPTVLKKDPGTTALLKVPENTPTTPATVKSISSKPNGQFDTGGNVNNSTDIVNKNLFGTPDIKASIKSNLSSNTPSLHTPTIPDTKNEVNVKSTSSLFMTSSVDPKSFWGKKFSTNPSEDLNVSSREIPTGDSPETNEPVLLSFIPSSNATNLDVETIVRDSATEVLADLHAKEESSRDQDLSTYDVPSASASEQTVGTSDESQEKVIQEPQPPLHSNIAAFSSFSIPATKSKPGTPLSGNLGQASSTGGFSGSPFGAKVIDTSLFVPPGGLFSAITKNPSPGSKPTLNPVLGADQVQGIVSTSTVVSEKPVNTVLANETATTLSDLVSTSVSSSTGIFGTIVSSSSKSVGGLFGGFAAGSSQAPLFGTPVATTLSLSSGLSEDTKVITTSDETSAIEATTITTNVGFLSSATTTMGTGGLFAASATTAITSGLLGSATTTATTAGLFGGTTTAAATGGLFGGTMTTAATGGLFGGTTTAAATGGLFGGTTTTAATGGLFGGTTTTAATGGLFGGTTTIAATGGLFGGTTTAAATGGLFGGTTNTSATGVLFGGAMSNAATASTGGLFGAATATAATGGLFGGSATTASTGLFGTTASATTSSSSGLFGNATSISSTGGLFGGSSTASTGGLFGTTTTTSASGSVFGGQTGFFKTPSSSAGGIFGGTSTSSSLGGGLFGAPASTSGNIFSNVTGAAPTNAFGSTGFAVPAQSKEGGGFGGFGLGGGPVNDPNKNPFGAVASSAGNNSNNIFGTPSAASTFGQAPSSAALGSGTFSKGFGSGITSGGFGTSTFGTPPPPAAAPSFGGAATFGSPPAFGGTPAFGGAPTFGASPPSSTFGSGSTFGSASTFGGGGGGSVFGGGSALPSFGSLASSDSTPAFGAPAAQPSFGFGEVNNTPNPNPSGQQFSSWR